MKLAKWLSPIVALSILCHTTTSQAQPFFKDRKLYLNEDGSEYFKITLLSQFWLRQQQYNPGTTVSGTPKESGTDIGIRRFRMQMYGQLTDRVFMYSQIGINNFNSISDRKPSFFIHDAVGEYAVIKRNMSLGIGLTGWNGLSRFSSPSTGAILGVDAPLYLQTTNDVTDQFLRKLSVYAKGKIGKLDYRLTMAQPMAIQKSVNYNSAISSVSSFSPKAPNMQWNGYFQYQFWDEESNLTPYMVGSYLGKKKVLTVGAGFVYQKDAMWHSTPTFDTVMSNMVHVSADIFYDAPIASQGQSISAYGNIAHLNFGKDYIRNQAVMNPANGTTNSDILNGSGNGYPACGTGTVLYAQVGYKFKDNLIGQTTLMPYAAWQHADFERLDNKMNFIDLGVNWLLSGNTSKFTVSYQNRPVYNNAGAQTQRMGGVTAQYQVFFN